MNSVGVMNRRSGSAFDRFDIGLVTIESIVGASALVCGVIMVFGDLGLPERVLDQTPFESFLIPGLILSFVVGGTLLTAVALKLKDHRASQLVSFVAGVILLGWIVVEAYMVHEGRALQLAIGLAAVAVIALALLTRSERNPCRS
jgi:hypothetical protein